jgi:hypothetical protein
VSSILHVSALLLCRHQGAKEEQYLQICACVDDVTILAKTENELKTVYQILEEAANELGSYTNEAKTKYMTITNKQGRLHSNSTEIGSKTF